MKYTLAGLLLLIILFQTYFALFDFHWPFSKPPIKVGVLFASTGHRAAKEKLVQQSTLMAIEEINRKGGIRGRKIIPYIRDTKSNLDVTFTQAKHLIEEGNIDFFFGCWLLWDYPDFISLLTKHDVLLFSPFQYEGVFAVENVIFTSISANQQAPVTIHYAMEHFGKRIFLIGSDFPYAHIINKIAKDQITAVKGEIAGEVYIPLGSDQVDEAIEMILKAEPDAILCSILGEHSSLFFKKLKKYGITPEKLPVFCFCLTELTLQNVINPEDYIGHFATWNYFQSIDDELNKKFVKDYLNFSHSKVVDNSVESGYVSVQLFSKAMEETELINVPCLISTLRSMRIQAPEGPITMTTEGCNAWKFSRIGRIRPDKQFDIIWKSSHPIRPIPYQIYRSQEEWKEMLNEST